MTTTAEKAPPGYKLIAWEGVGLFVPARWEIGRHSGDFRKGFMRIDDDTRIVIQARWWEANALAPIARLVEQHARGVAGRDRQRKPPVFRPTDAFDLPGGNDQRAAAFSAPATDAFGGETLVIYQRPLTGRVLVLRFLRNANAPDDEQIKTMLSGLRMVSPEESREWAFHDLIFTTPPGWTLIRDHLYAGVAFLEFKRKRDRIAIRRFSAADAVMGTETPGLDDLERWCRLVYAQDFFDMRYRIEAGHDSRKRTTLRLTGSRRLMAPIEMRWLIPKHRRLPRRIDIIWDPEANKIYCLEIRRPTPALETDINLITDSLGLNIDPSIPATPSDAGQREVEDSARARSLNARAQQRQNIRAQVNSQGRTVLKYHFPRPRKLRWLRWLTGLDAGPERVEKQVELDLVGSLVWQQCAQSPPVSQLIEAVHQRFRISYREAELSVTDYIRAMGSRGLLSVKFDDPA